MFARSVILPLACVLLIIGTAFSFPVWGFYCHKLINRLAVFSLPQEMFPFYRQNIHQLTVEAVKPDQRRYILEAEGPMHYIDLDEYPDSTISRWMANPQYFDSLSEETWMSHGALPRRILTHSYALIAAFHALDEKNILRYSSELGHYIGDAHVPLHTTSNYDGQQTGQHGIHGLWESRLPELFSDQYELGSYNARYIPDLNLAVWEVIQQSHQAVDSVLSMEKILTERYGNKIRTYDSRGLATTYQYSPEFAQAYHKALDGMVERRLCSSIRFTADVWYTCWILGGQPLMGSQEVKKSRSQ